MAARKRRNTRSPVRRRKSNSNLKNVAAFVVGGAAGAMAGGMMVRSGVSPTTAAVGITVAGSAAALGLRKSAQLAAGGAAAAGAGQLALAFLASQAKKNQPTPKKIVVTKNGVQPRQDAYGDDIDAAFSRAREQMSMEDEVAAFTDEYDDEEVVTIN